MTTGRHRLLDESRAWGVGRRSVPGPLLIWWLLLAALTFVFSLQIALIAKPVFEIDEAAHLAYAISVAHGVLPTVETPMLEQVAAIDFRAISSYVSTVGQSHSTIWVANHPPFFYMLSAPLVWISQLTGADELLSFGMRVLSALSLAGATYLTGVLAFVAVPTLRLAAVIAPALMVVFKANVYAGGLVFNDGLALMLSTLLLVLAARAVRDGLTAGLCLAVGVVGTCAALTRVSTLPIVFGVVVAIAVVGVRHHRSAAEMVRCLAAAAGIPTLLAGWFYIRNVAAYGSPTASKYLLDRFGRVARFDGTADLRMSKAWTLQGWSQLVRGTPRVTPMQLWWPWPQILGLILLGSLCFLIARGTVRLVRASSPIEYLADKALWIVMVGSLVATWWSMLTFTAAGGTPHARYFGAVASTLALLMARGVSAIPSIAGPQYRRAVIWAVAIAAVGASVAYSVLNQIWLMGWMAWMRRSDIPAAVGPTWWITGGLVVAMVPVMLRTIRVCSVEPSGRRGPSAQRSIDSGLQPSQEMWGNRG